MVVATSSHPSETEQKKRKQTLERAKVNHLSKQLQLRLQYAKLKVEHGWQRQNLNEVENLYFHHSHLRNIRPSSTNTKAQSRNVATTPSASVSFSESGPPVAMAVDGNSTPRLPPPATASEHSYGPSPSSQTSQQHLVASDGSQLVSTSNAISQTFIATQSLHEQGSHVQSDPSSEAPPESMSATQTDSQSSSVHTPVPVQAAQLSRSLSNLDSSDPGILARFAQIRAQTQSQSRPLSHSPSQPSQTQTQGQSLSGQPTGEPDSLEAHSPLAPMSQPTIASPPFTSQPQAGPVLPTSFTVHPPTTTNPTATTMAITSATVPSLTYDSFWSTHSSTSGTARALYRTNAGFSASATATGHVAMLTPGGHSAVMTADGVYVGGGGVAKGVTG